MSKAETKNTVGAKIKSNPKSKILPAVTAVESFFSVFSGKTELNVVIISMYDSGWWCQVILCIDHSKPMPTICSKKSCHWIEAEPALTLQLTSG